MLLAASAIARAVPATSPIDITVAADGSVLWNSDVFAHVADVEPRIKDAAQHVPQPEFRVHPDRRARYQDVAAILALLQKYGLHNLGFVGNERPD
jgi:biopolymer transport protein ExbD